MIRGNYGQPPRKRCRGNLRPAPFGITPSVVSRVLELIDARFQPKVIEVPVLAVKLVDRPRRSQDPRLAKANDDIQGITPPPARMGGGDEPGRVAPPEESAPVLHVAEVDPAPEDWPDAPLPEHADPDLDRPAPHAPDEAEPYYAPDNAIGQVLPEGRQIVFPVPGKPLAPTREERDSRPRVVHASGWVKDVSPATEMSRIEMIRAAARKLQQVQAATPRIPAGKPVPRAPMAIPALPFEQRRAELARAIAFLKARCVLVSVQDRTAAVRRYTVSGKRDAKYAEEVIEIARSWGMEA